MQTGMAESIIASILLVLFIVVVYSRQALAKSRTWTLAEALSEPTETSVDPTGQLLPNGQRVTLMRASSSRLIAYFGSLAVLALYLGFGTLVLFSLAEGKGVPDGTKDVLNYLLTGATLFLPYAANKLIGLNK